MQASKTDAELCKASSGGNEEAFVELVRRYQGAVCAVTYAISEQHALSEDLAQDTFLLAWKKLPGIETPQRVGAWLAGIARNLSRRSRRRVRPESLAESSGAHPMQPDADPEEAIVQHEDRARLWELLGTLPERIREAMILYYREEQSAVRVAQLLGISVSATEQRLSRGRKQLRDKFERALDRELREQLERTRPTDALTRKVAAILPLGVPLTLSAEQLAQSVAHSSPAAGTVTKAIAMKKLVAAIVAILAIVAVAVVTSSGRESEVPAKASVDLANAAQPDRGAVQAPSPTPRGLVGGSVVDATTGKAIAQAVITLTTVAGAPVVLRQDGQATGLAVARSGDEGRFSIAGVPPGRYVATATATGHLPTRADPFVLALEDSREDLQLVLATGGHTVTGNVLDIGGGPVEGAVVRAKSRGRPSVATMTDPEGRYALTLPDGSYGLTAWEVDYQPAKEAVVLAGGDRIVDLTLVPGAAIFGTVVDRVSGQPVPRATVSFDLETSRGSSRRARKEEAVVTDARGQFALRQLGAAHYGLVAAADHRASRAPAEVSLAIAEQLSGVVVLVDAAHNTTGRVVDGQGAPVGDVDVEAVTMSDAPPVNARSDRDGRFTLLGVVPGTYSLLLGGEAILPSQLETTFEVGHEDVRDLEVVVQRGTTLRGTVHPPGIAEVSLHPGASVTGFARMTVGAKANRARGRSAADGTFELSAVPTGDWRLVATAADGSHGEVELTISDAGLEGVAVELTPRATVRGTIVDTSGAVLADAKVHIDPDGPPGPVRVDGITDQTDAKGAFELVGLVDGDYRLVVTNRSGSRLVEVGASLEDRGTPVTVLDGASPTVRLEVTQPAGEIAGVVLDADGGPHPDAWITLVVASGEGYRGRFGRERPPTTSGPDGTFRLDELPDGDYTLEVSSRKGDAVAEVAQVSAGTTDVRVQLSALASLTGRVTMNGRAVTQFEVHAGTALDRAFVTQDGRFEVGRLAPGSLAITVVAKQGAVTRVIDLSGATSVSEMFELQAWGTVTGRVTDTQGTPQGDVAVRVYPRGGDRDAGQRLANELAGVLPRTDAEGRFTVGGVGTGRGSIRFGGEGSWGAQPGRGEALFYVEPGATVDLGDVRLLDLVTVAQEQAGTLGLTLAARYDAPTNDSPAIDRPAAPGRLWVNWVEPGSVAEQAGLVRGQRVLAIDDHDVETLGVGAAALMLGSSRVEAGRRYTLKIEHEDGPATVQLVAVAVQK